jgi:hypothetical protein
MSYIIAIGHRVLIGWLCMEMEVEKRDQAVTRDMESRYYPWIMVGYREPGYLTSCAVLDIPHLTCLPVKY